MAKILINASTNKYGGGLSVALNFIHALQKHPQKYSKLWVIGPKNAGYENIIQSPVEFIAVPGLLLKWFFRILLDYFWLRKKIKILQPNVVLSFTNLAAPIHENQIYMFDNPFSALKSCKGFNLSAKARIIHTLRNFVFRRRLKFADIVFAQTNLQAERLSAWYPSGKIRVIPNCYSKLYAAHTVQKINLKKDESYLYFLCFSRYYPHKNLEILIPLAQKIRQRNLAYKIIITIEKKHGTGAARFLKTIQKEKLDNVIINTGEVPSNAIPDLYQKADACLFPTLLESYSAFYAEAIFFNKPMFTSCRPFAREICKDTAFYFDPFDAEDILNVIDGAYSKNEIMEEKKAKIKVLKGELRSWEETAGEYLEETAKLFGF